MNLFCPWEPATFLFFSANVPAILYYAIIPGMIISVFFSILLFLKNRKNVSVRNLIYISILFFLWGFFALILFATNNPDEVMFYWSLTILAETLIYLMSVHFTYSFLYNRKLSFNKAFLSIIPILPIIFFLSTNYNLIGVNLSDCTAIEGPIALYYSYVVEIFYLIVILILAINKYRRSQKLDKKKILYFSFGIILFLITFSSGNIIGSFTDDWVLSQLGYFGMPIFIGLLAYIIVKYQAFNIKLLATQTLVWGLAVLIGSQFFFIQTTTNFILTGITFVGVVIAGRFLIISVRREVMQREQLQILSEQLFEANDKLKSLDKLKTEFVSLASHQLRSPLTAIKGYASMLVEGDYGEIQGETKEAVSRIFQSCQNLTRVVEDLLDVTKIEQGGMKFVMEPFNLIEIARDMAKDLSITAEGKGLKLNFSSDDEVCMINGDKEKIRQVVLNFIDNSIKYTKVGEINVSVKKIGGKCLFSVKDTGVGMTEAIKATLFQKFVRGDGGQMNTTGSGLGLYLAKEIVEAHHGRVWVDSEGVNKGSVFNMELDIVK